MHQATTEHDGARVDEYVVVALAPGARVLPALSLRAFDPATGVLPL